MSKNFFREDWHKKKRLSKSWRKPKGVQACVRLKKGRERCVSIGYGSPKSDIVMVVEISNEKQVTEIKKGAVILIPSKVGTRNRVRIIEKALEKGIKIMNIKDPALLVDQVNKMREEKAKLKKEKEKKKEDTKKDEKTKEKASIEDKLSDEEKKKLEKQEIDRLLTKKF